MNKVPFFMTFVGLGIIFLDLKGVECLLFFFNYLYLKIFLCNNKKNIFYL